LTAEAVARGLPMPREAPVITATLPSKEKLGRGMGPVRSARFAKVP
jgi:hypothetical protein